MSMSLNSLPRGGDEITRRRLRQDADPPHNVMEHASAGMIGVNIGVPVPREPFSFGGWNESRFGSNDITGKSSIEFWTKLKKTTTKWNPEAGVNWMS